MKTVPFLRYVRMAGRFVTDTVELDDHLGEMGEDIMRVGYRFESMYLRDGTLALSIHDTVGNEAVSMEISPNDPVEIKTAVEKLIRKFAQKAGVV